MKNSKDEPIVIHLSGLTGGEATKQKEKDIADALRKAADVAEGHAYGLTAAWLNHLAKQIEEMGDIPIIPSRALERMPHEST